MKLIIFAIVGIAGCVLTTLGYGFENENNNVITKIFIGVGFFMVAIGVSFSIVTYYGVL